LLAVNKVVKFSLLLVSLIHVPFEVACVVGLVVTVSALQALLSIRIMRPLVQPHTPFVIGFIVTLRTLEVLDPVFNMNADVTVQIAHLVRRVVAIEAVELLPAARVVLLLHVSLQMTFVVCPEAAF
jgi:hypothetical protein